jgi:hypothetical protein
MNQEISAKIGVRRVEGGQVIGVNIGELYISPDYFKARPTALQRAFDSFIADRTKGFVGRQFVFEALDAFLADERQESGYFIIRGEPGIGKSALIAYLVKNWGYIHHFNIALQAINRPRQFLSSICAQLIDLFKLEHPTVPDDAYESGALLNELLAEAGNKLERDERLVVAIDALDEVDATGVSGRANLLYLPESLPTGVFVVVTTRPKHDMHLRVTNSRTLDLEADSAGNVRDVREYIQSHLSDKQMQKRLVAWGTTPEQFTEAMLKKSEGNFMYLRHVLPAVKAGRFMHGRLDELPDGLLAYYRSHWAQMREQDAATIVCVLAAVKEAVSVDQIAAFTELDPDWVRQVVREWREFLYEERGTEAGHLYRVYHATFQEFLKEEVDPGLRTYHTMITRYYLKLAGKAK